MSISLEKVVESSSRSQFLASERERLGSLHTAHLRYVLSAVDSLSSSPEERLRLLLLRLRSLQVSLHAKTCIADRLQYYFTSDGYISIFDAFS